MVGSIIIIFWANNVNRLVGIGERGYVYSRERGWERERVGAWVCAAGLTWVPIRRERMPSYT